MSTLLARRPLIPSFLDDDTFGFPEGFLDDERLSLPSRLFNRPLLRDVTIPAVNIKDNTKSFDIEIAVPGYKKDDLKVVVDNGVLTISSERKKENETERNGYTRREFSYSSFKRSFILPENTDEGSVKAQFADGILKLSIAKTKELPEKKGREIKIG